MSVAGAIVRPAGRPTGGWAGFSLLELIVATAVAGIVLTSAWAWCWTLSASCRAGAERADAASTIAAVRRLTTAELGESLGLVAGAAVPCSATSLAFTVPSTDAAGTDLVTYGYDAGRGVVWRKSPSSHLAESVAAFSVLYLDARGQALSPGAGGDLAAAELPLVRRVVLTVAVRSGAQSTRAGWQVCLPCVT
jgi:prepilin-type N-terminal cleavage/methylation domain-containing protein